MIKVIKAHLELFACPTIIVGETDDGCTIYARYRWGHLSVRIDPREDPPHGGAEGTWIYEGQIGGEYDGCLAYMTLIKETEHLIEWPVEIDK